MTTKPVSKPKKVNLGYDTEKWLTISEALIASGYGNAYLRMKLLKPGKITSVKEMIPGTQIPRTLIDRASFESWMSTHPRTGALTLEEKTAVAKLLQELRGE